MNDKEQDIRWEQSFSNFQKALGHLKKFIDKGELSELEAQGLIKAFEHTFELSWTTLKVSLEYRGQTDIYGSCHHPLDHGGYNRIGGGKLAREIVIETPCQAGTGDHCGAGIELDVFSIP